MSRTHILSVLHMLSCPLCIHVHIGLAFAPLSELWMRRLRLPGGVVSFLSSFGLSASSARPASAVPPSGGWAPSASCLCTLLLCPSGLEAALRTSSPARPAEAHLSALHVVASVEVDWFRSSCCRLDPVPCPLLFFFCFLPARNRGCSGYALSVQVGASLRLLAGSVHCAGRAGCGPFLSVCPFLAECLLSGFGDS